MYRFDQNINVYFDGRTGFIRLLSGTLDCIDNDDSGLVDKDAPPISF